MRVITDYEEYNKLWDQGFSRASSLLFEWVDRTAEPASSLNLTVRYESQVEKNLMLTVSFHGVSSLEHASPLAVEEAVDFLMIESIRSRQMENLNFRASEIEERMWFLFDGFYAVVED